MLQGRREEALASLSKYRRGKFTDDQIAEEFDLLQLGIAHEHERGRYIELWQGVNLRRTLITVFSNFFLQATGQSFAVSYGAVFVKSLNTVNQFYITLAWTLANILFGIFAMVLVEKTGRRLVLHFQEAVLYLYLMIMY